MEACICCWSSRSSKLNATKLKVIVKDREAIINTSKNDLIKFNAKTNELALQLNNAHQKVEHEVAVNMSIRADKRKVEEKLTEASVENQELQEENAKLKEEAK